MLDLSIAYSGLRVSQLAMNVAANNIANVNTPGYHRQVVRPVEAAPQEIANLLLGSGVDLEQIQRLRHQLLESALTANLSEQKSAAAGLEILQQVEALLSPGSGSLQDRVETFFNELERLTARPDDDLQRAIVIRSAEAMTSAIRSLMDGFGSLRNGVAAEAQSLVDTINARAVEISDLNNQIGQALALGLQPNDQLDRRDQLVNELAEIIDAEVARQGANHDVVVLGAGTAIIGEKPVPLQLSRDPAGQLELRQPEWDDPVHAVGGRLAGLLAAHNEMLARFENQIQTFTASLVQAMDRVHATGLGLTGPLTELRGSRSVTDVAAPLSTAGLAFPVSRGELFFSVTNLTSGQRQGFSLGVDPETQSLQDVAAAISALPHLQGIVDAATGLVTIQAESGFAFDFAGRLDTSPDASAVSGTARATLSGAYQGASNDTWTFQVLGGGSVGLTSGLQVAVRNTAGNLVATLNVGEGYEAGTRLEVADGVQIAFGPGTFNAGDTFSTRVASEGDTSGILAALGLNTFFAGAGAANIEVSAALREDPQRLATSSSGQRGDIQNLVRLIGVRDARLTASGNQTPGEFLASITADVGDRVRSGQAALDHVQMLGQQLETERESYSGVDPNQEMLEMLKWQRAYQAATRLIVAAQEMTDELLQAIR